MRLPESERLDGDTKDGPPVGHSAFYSTGGPRRAAQKNRPAKNLSRIRSGVANEVVWSEQ